MKTLAWRDFGNGKIACELFNDCESDSGLPSEDKPIVQRKASYNLVRLLILMRFVTKAKKSCCHSSHDKFRQDISSPWLPICSLRMHHRSTAVPTVQSSRVPCFYCISVMWVSWHRKFELKPLQWTATFKVHSTTAASIGNTRSLFKKK